MKISSRARRNLSRNGVGRLTMNEHDIMEALQKVLDKTEETSDCVRKLDKKVDLHIQKTEIELEHIRELDEKQNQLLDEHSARSDRLEKDNQLREQSLRQDFEGRFQEIEKPREWLKMTGKILFWTASSAGALYGAWEFFSFIKPFLF